MSARKCASCGKDPAEGFASVYRDGKEQWYCHPDDGPSCYADTRPMIRDISAVKPGERVYAHMNGGLAAGVYVGTFNGRIKVDHTTTYSHSPIGDALRFVTDVDGNVLGSQNRCTHGCLQGRCGYQTCPMATPEETKP